MGRFVDFRTVRSRIKMVDACRHYGMTVDEDAGFQCYMPCPLPTHDSSSKRNKPFSVSLARNIWRCFVCGKSGNVIDFVCYMEGLDPKDMGDFREAAMRMGEWPEMNDKKPATSSPPATAHVVKEEDKPTPKAQAPAAEEIINAPLDFELKSLDTSHETLQQFGVSIQTLARFGLGYCSKGMLKGRIAVPVHNADAELIGYAGWLPEGETISTESPRLKLPGVREFDGKRYRFDPGALLFNEHRLLGLSDVLWVTGDLPTLLQYDEEGESVVGILSEGLCDAQVLRIAELTSSDTLIHFLLRDGETLAPAALALAGLRTIRSSRIESHTAITV
jgi:DNA primase